MSTYLDFDSTKSFRDKLISKTLQVENGPQTFTANNFILNTLNEYSNVKGGSVDGTDSLQNTQSVNTYKPLEYTVTDSFSVLPRRANLSLYPYFNSNLDHTLTSVLISDNFESESELFKFNANYIKNNPNGPLQSRIKQNLSTTTLGRVRLLDAIDGSLSTLTNIVTGKEPLIELNNSITVSSSLLGNVVDFAETVAGVTVPWSEIPGDYLTNPKNTIQNPISSIIDTIGKALGFKNKKTVIRPSDLFLDYMGSGPKRTLFENLSYSKYAPNYKKYTSLLYGTFDLGKPYIGDDRDNDAKYTMSDFEDRVVKSPHNLSVMFDDTTARLFQTDKNIGDGGNVAGCLTWYNSKRKTKIGEINEKSISSNNTFRESSILSVTQDLIDSMPTDKVSARSHTSNAIEQTSRIFSDGDILMSKGSAVIKYINKDTKVEDGTEYCRAWTKDKPYFRYSNTMRTTGLLRKFDSSVMSTPWNLNIGPVSDGKQGFEQSTNMEKFGGGFRAKKYMFSIENLSWKTSNKPEFTYEDLPYCERGPNGGRVMWFPPYGLDVSETNGARWEDNVFVGRPEPIFTYQSTTRGANLKFKIVVDHPSIINVMTSDHFEGMDDHECDMYINSFFAGCNEIDFYDLIKRYSMLSTTDVATIIAYLNNGSDTGVIKRYKTKIDSQGGVTPNTNTTTNVEIKSTLYFNNGKPENGTKLISNETFGDLFNGYSGDTCQTAYLSDLTKGLNDIKPNSPNNKFDYKILTKLDRPDVLSDEQFNILIANTKTNIESGFITAKDEYTKLVNGVNELKNKIKDKKVKKVTISIESAASAAGTKINNLELTYRRSYSVILELLKQLSFDGNVDGLKSKIVWKNSIKSSTTSPQSEFNNEPLSFKFSDVGYQEIEGVIEFKLIVNHGENYQLTNMKVNCDDTSLFKSSLLKKTAPESFWCRQSKVNLKYTINDTIQGSDTRINKITVEEFEEKIKSKPTIDVLKKIVMKVLNESYYFKKLEESSPLQFSSLTEKLRYFHPSFHSTTPEGLNSRLTFLHQCIRPGDTIPVKGLADDNDLNARNTSFGPPPIIILRVGDFYNTKAIIRDLNITFDQNTWDLNPEGIGVQPMIADVTLSLSFFGGQGMERPVNELQNALSSNFYANTEVYDYRATATEDRTKFNKKILSDILNYKKIDTTQTVKDLLNTSNVTQNKSIGDEIKDGVSYTDSVKNLFTITKDYYTLFNNFISTNQPKYGNMIMSLILSDKYRTINKYTVNVDSGNTTNVDLLGNYVDTDICLLTSKLNNIMSGKIDVEPNICNVFNITINDSMENLCFNETIKTYLKQKVSENIDTIYNCGVGKIESKRDEIIKTLDKLNFVVKNGVDGKIDNNNDIVGHSLSGFTSSKLYDEYSKVISGMSTNHSNFMWYNDDTFNLDAITEPQFQTLLKGLVINTTSDVTNFIDVFKNKAVGRLKYEPFLKTLKTELDKIQKTNNVDSNYDTNNKIIIADISNFPVINSTLNLDFKYDQLVQFTEIVKDELVKVNKTNKNKTTDTLNYYRL